VLRQIGFYARQSAGLRRAHRRQFLRFIARATIAGFGVDERIDFLARESVADEKGDQKIKQLSRACGRALASRARCLSNPASSSWTNPPRGLDSARAIAFRHLFVSTCETRARPSSFRHTIFRHGKNTAAHIAIMSAGSIVQLGTVAEVAAPYRRVALPYTVRLGAEPVAALDQMLQLDRRRNHSAEPQSFTSNTVRPQTGPPNFSQS